MSQVEQVSNDAPIPAMGVGDQLKAAREARRMTLGEVSQAIKISPRLLEQVEANAWGEMPGHTFARGMVRSYAKLLQIDPAPLLKSLEDAPLPKLPLLDMPSPTHAALPASGQAQRRDRLTVGAGVLLVLLAVLAYFIIPDGWLEKSPDNLASPEGSLASPPATLVPPVSPMAPTESGSTAGEPVAPADEGSAGVPGVSGVTSGEVQQPQPTLPTPSSPAVPAAPPQAAPLSPAQPAAPAVPTASPTAPAAVQTTSAGLVFRFTDTSWIEVTDGSGAVLLSGNFDAGNSRQLRGEGPFTVALGNAEGVIVSYRGRPVDLKPHTRQKVARFTLE